MELTEEQVSMARHALGLDGRRKKSYRNRYVTGSDGKDYAPWMAMVEAGLAGRRDGKTMPYGGDDLFWLTHEGACAVLRKGESLDPEDFPAGGEA